MTHISSSIIHDHVTIIRTHEHQAVQAMAETIKRLVETSFAQLATIKTSLNTENHKDWSWRFIAMGTNPCEEQ